MHNSNPLMREYIKINFSLFFQFFSRLKKIMNRYIPLRRESIEIKILLFLKKKQPNGSFYST